MALTEYYKTCRFSKIGQQPAVEPEPPKVTKAKLKGPTAKARTRKHLAQIRTKRAMREHVLELDGERCRWPDCDCQGELEIVHWKAEGAGGDPMLNRYEPENLIAICPGKHRTDARSLHSGLARMQPLDPTLGMRGEVQFFQRESTEAARWYLVGISAPPKKETD